MLPVVLHYVTLVWILYLVALNSLSILFCLSIILKIFFTFSFCHFVVCSCFDIACSEFSNFT